MVVLYEIWLGLEESCCGGQGKGLVFDGLVDLLGVL